MHRLTIDLVELREYADGRTVDEIASHYGRAVSTIYGILSQHKIKFKFKTEDRMQLSDHSKLAKRVLSDYNRTHTYTREQGVRLLAAGVVVYALMDGVDDYKTKDLFEALSFTKEQLKEVIRKVYEEDL